MRVNSTYAGHRADTGLDLRAGRAVSHVSVQDCHAVDDHDMDARLVERLHHWTEFRADPISDQKIDPGVVM
jgi:hypothetical protein